MKNIKTKDAPAKPKTVPVPDRPLTLDPRRNAYRPDLAATSLEGKVNADAFVEGTPARVIRPNVPVRRSPDYTRGLETEALFGEAVTVYHTADGWAWVQLESDGYVGYVPADTIGPADTLPTHRVSALGTFVYPVPDIKTPPVMLLAMNAPVAVRGGDEKFSELVTGGLVVSRHLSPPGKAARDFVEVAERFIGSPYLWGGRTRIGIDCSGLVQTSLHAAGLTCPRDSDMQHAELGDPVLVPANMEGLQRGDLVFWKGHVGIMADSIMMVHANAHHMAVVIEPLPEAANRIIKTGGPVTGIKRLKRAAA
jgi:cell wall-associated NlpC family hydrolase